ncbi:hypothetical protein ACQEV2_27730 [Streptomyces sp. CA-251387]|uniref:hypothetical protein n=1 Tax=Streptomyces sp. CA-251387 TaxID=3240064 RepID=UPI003D8FBA69
MHIYLVVAAALSLGLLGVLGIVTITTGWVVPFGRARVLRPTLWGYGSLVSAVGGAVFVFLGPLAETYGPLPWAGWFVMMAGLGLQMLAQRPGRGATNATKTAS